MKKLVIGFDEIENESKDIVFDEITKNVNWDIISDYILNEFNWDYDIAFKYPDIDWINKEIHLTFTE